MGVRKKMVDVIHSNVPEFELDFDYDNYASQIEEEMDQISDVESFEKIVGKHIEAIDSLISLAFDEEGDDIFSNEEVLKDFND